MKPLFTRTRTVASVTAGLAALVTDLDAVAKEQAAEAARCNTVITDALDQRDAANAEMELALRSATAIQKLLG